MSQQYLIANIRGRDEEFPLDAAGRCRIGRTTQNTIMLDDDLVSRDHAMIQGSENLDFYLMDLGSRNGTLVNGAEVKVSELKNGDRLQLGSHLFQIVLAKRARGPKTYNVPLE